MGEVTLSWSEFQEECAAFCAISDKLADTWTLFTKDAEVGNSFLIYKQKIASEAASVAEDDSSDDVPDESGTASTDVTPELVQLEYHVVYSISYQVPVLYFQAHKSDGGLLSLEDAWRIFRCYDGDEDGSFTRKREHMLGILTQMEHPVLFKPFLAIHPCRTAHLLGQAAASRNRVLTFISLMGPYVQLQLNNAYGLIEEKPK